MSLPIEVEILILASALERSKEYEARCKRNVIRVQIEARHAAIEVELKQQELSELRQQYLGGVEL